ncbi:MAG: methyltransferase [Candidatus Dormiibacterota bacterium]
MSSAEPAVDLWTLSDLCTPWCIRVVVTLHIAEHIASGVTDIAALAAATSSDTDALHSVLSYLVARGVFIEEVPGRFALNDTAQGLLNAGLFLGLDGIGGRMTHVWSTLPSYVRTGKPGYADVFGAPFWDDLAAHPDVAADFDALMGYMGHGTPDAALKLARGGWEDVHTLVDVGGGTGAMLAALLRAQPHLRGTLVDLPGPVTRSREIFEAAGVADRVTSVAQSFFDPLPAGADVYLLRKVLNDWPDRETVEILRRCADAARPSGTIVAIGGVVPDGTPRPLSVEMLLVGGRTNTLPEFRELARQADLEIVATESGLSHFLIECRPLVTG